MFSLKKPNSFLTKQKHRSPILGCIKNHDLSDPRPLKNRFFLKKKSNLFFYQIFFDFGPLLALPKHPKTAPGTSQNHPGVLSEVWDLPKPPQGPFWHHFINILYEFCMIFGWKSVKIDNLPKRESRNREPPPAGIGNLPQRESGILNLPPLESVTPPAGIGNLPPRESVT